MLKTLQVLGLLVCLGAWEATRASPTPRAPAALPNVRPTLYLALGHTAPMTTMAWSPNGRTLATGSVDHTVVLWDAADWRPRATLIGLTHEIVSLAWSPDGKTVAASDAADRTLLWDAFTGMPRARLQGGLRPMMHQGFGLYWSEPHGIRGSLLWPDGTTLATCYQDQFALLWDVAIGKRRALLKLDAGTIDVMACSPDGKTLAIGDNIRSVTLWDIATGKRRASLAGEAWVTSLAWSPDSKTLASSDFSTVTLWDAATGQRRIDLAGDIEGHEAAALAWSPDGRTLATLASADRNTWELWDAATGRRRVTLRGPEPRFPGQKSLAWSPDGRILATCDDTTVILWEADSGERRTTLEGIRGPVAWNPDGRTLATGAFYQGQQTAIIWNGITGQPRVYLAPRVASIADGAVNWRPDGKAITIAAADGLGATGAVWDVTTGKRLAALFADVNALVWSPNGRTLAVDAGYDKTLLWDAATQKPRATLDGAESPRAWSPEGRALAASSPRYGVCVWDPVSGKALATLDGSTKGGPPMPAGGFGCLPPFPDTQFSPEVVTRCGRLLPEEQADGGKPLETGIVSLLQEVHHHEPVYHIADPPSRYAPGHSRRLGREVACFGPVRPHPGSRPGPPENRALHSHRETV